MALTRWMAIGDTHGDKADAGAVDTALSFARSYRPEVRLHLGDAFDFRWLRSRASLEERAEDVKADLDAGLSLLREWRPTHYLWGNHERRLLRALSSTEGQTRAFVCEIIGRIDQAVGEGQQKRYSVRDGVVEIGDHRFIHGFGAGVHAARAAALHFGNVVMGHTHAIDMVTVGYWPDRKVGRTVGCLCDLEMQYAEDRLATLRWAHGFVYGAWDKGSGRVWTWQAERLEGRWNLPSENDSSGS